RTWQIETGELAEIFLAVLAVAHARAGPAIRKDPIHAIESDNLFSYRGHELEVVGTECTGDPEIFVGRMTPLVSICVYGDPIGMGVIDILMRTMRIGAANHVHA